MNLKNKKILLTGANGFLGKHVYEELLDRGVPKISIFAPSSKKLDFRKWEDCRRAVKNKDIVIHLAAKIGGIGFNKEKPGEIFYDNALMGIQLMEAARQAGVEKFVSVGTVCSYPKNSPLPFKEKDLWNGYPEEITAPYGMAKKMLLVQGKAYYEQYGFKSIMLLPVNLYGPGDHFDSNYSHVMTALIKRIVDAKYNNEPKIVIWGTGKAHREFVYVKDAARAIVLAAEKYEDIEPVNLGSGQEISIKEIVKLICHMAGYKGKTEWDRTKPDGVLRRNMDTSKALKKLNFRTKVKLNDGLKETIDWYINNYLNKRK